MKPTRRPATVKRLKRFAPYFVASALLLAATVSAAQAPAEDSSVPSAPAISGPPSEKPEIASPDAGKAFGRVWRIAGDVTAAPRTGANARHLQSGDQVFVDERVQTSLGGEVVFKENDGGLIAIRPNSDLRIDAFAAEGKKTDHVQLHLFVGSLRAITGWIGRINRPADRIVTPTATIGIRGTDHDAYVLSPELASANNARQGSYDKVNRGETVLAAGDKELALTSGQVGFVPAKRPTTRGLMTLLLPVLLDSVPSFYVGGQFDAEVDQYSETAERTSDAMLRQLQSGAAPEAATCDAMHIARDWTRAFDGALRRRDLKTLLALFSDDVTIKATVHDSDGVLTTLDVDRDQFVQSTVSSMKSLRHYQQKRLTLVATPADEPAAENCSAIKVESSVVESGMLQTKRYHIESTETYLLKRRDGSWVAVTGETVEH
jgi:hypothetical protein